MGLYDALNPERAVLYLDMKDSYDEIYGSNLIIGDPYDPTNWIADAGSTLSRLSEAYLGLDALRVESGVLANPNARGLFSTTSGKRYRLALALRNIGASYAAVFSGNMVLNTTSSNFTYLQKDFTAGSALFRLWNQSTAAGQYCDFSNLSLYELRRSCKNHGGLGPATVQLGDGFAGTSFPTLVKNGMTFNGSTSYINCGNAGETIVDNFTLYAYINPTRPQSSSGGRFLSRRGATTQWDFYLTNNDKFTMYDGTGLRFGSSYSFSTERAVMTAVVKNSQLYLYDNGRLDPIGALPTAITQKSVTTSVGCYMNPVNKGTFSGKMYSIALFPEAHSEIQIKEMTRRMMQNKFIG